MTELTNEIFNGIYGYLEGYLWMFIIGVAAGGFLFKQAIRTFGYHLKKMEGIDQ